MDNKTDWRIVSLTHDFSSNKIQKYFEKKITGLEKAAVLISPAMEKRDLADEIESKVGYSDKRTLGIYADPYPHL